jgi:hypothetical protein
MTPREFFPSMPDEVFEMWLAINENPAALQIDDHYGRL